MSGGVELSNVAVVAARAVSLWREARDRHRGRLDVYLKTAARARVTRFSRGGALQTSHAREQGTAVRLVTAGAPRASFAACAGASVTCVRWALAAATSSAPAHDPSMPATGAIALAERRDLDPVEALPDTDELTAWLEAHPGAEWVECGLTVEALVGDEGWVALRRRIRSWALLDVGFPRLVAQRGWRSGPDVRPEADDGLPRASGASVGTSRARLEPAAAATLVASMARTLHASPAHAGRAVAPDWALVDDPLDTEALFGGSFDDAGFPAERRVLADGRRAVQALDGPGTMRRPSYRDAPSSAPSHLVLRADKGRDAAVSGHRIARCRVVPLDGGDWLLRLDGRRAEDEPRFVMATPDEIPRRCVGTWGSPSLSAEGVVTPGLVMDFESP